MKRKEQHRSNNSTRMNAKGKNTSTGKGKRKVTQQPIVKKFTKSQKASEKLSKANHIQHRDKELAQKEEIAIVEEVTTHYPSRNESNQLEDHKLADQQKSSSDRNDSRRIDNKAEKFLEECGKSKYLKVGKRNVTTNELIAIQLPDGLPNKLLIKALLQEQQNLSVLREQIIQLDQADERSVDVHLETVNREQLSALVKELDELIGQFTARN